MSAIIISKVHLEDNMKILKRFSDKSIQLIVDDPPYFSGPERRNYYGTGVSKKGIKRVGYPVSVKWEVPGKAYFDELFRVSQHQIIWGCNYYDYIFPSPGRIVWDKCNQNTDYSDCEIAFCSLHDSVRMFRFMWNGMNQGKGIKDGHIMQGNKKLNEKRIHPTQKPVALYKWIALNYCQPKGIRSVFSPHVGSGSDRIAFYDAGIDFEGCELDPDHYENQANRFKLHTQKQTLFQNNISLL